MDDTTASHARELERLNALLTQHIQDLARSNAELEQFAYVVSHDLQEPLRSVVSFLQLLKERYDGQLDDKGRHFIARSVAGAQRMQAMILDLLKFSQVNREEVLQERTDCEKIFASALLGLQAMVEETRAVITHDPLPVLQAEPVQLGRLFQSLIENAMKFRRVEVSPVIHVSAKKNNGEWEFSVSDNGIGIEAQFFDRIFGIFEQLHARGDYPGTGIGLAIAKRIVERSKGHIWVDSKPGEGSTFYFTLLGKGDSSA